MVRTRRTAPWPALLLAIAIAAAACGDGAETVVVSGSSTVEPITIAVAEEFSDPLPDDEVSISVDGPGTGDGFELFCDGLIDINDASSKIKPEQIESCEESGVEFVELQIANDGIAVLTNEANDAVDCLTFADLYALTGPESQGIDRWDEAEPLAEELGSSTDLPEASLDIIGPGEESGTYSSYVELVVEEFNEDRGEPAQTRPDYQASGDDNVILQGVQGSSTSLGWVGYAFAEEAEGIKALEVDGGEGCVAPTPETIADGSYPVSRPLFIYVNAERAAASELLTRFVDFYLHDAIDSVADVGYVPLSDEDLAETRARWEARTTGAA
ncbi:MAG: substrate-binding domain-containing protein [Acidimicrobiia bacterium]